MLKVTTLRTVTEIKGFHEAIRDHVYSLSNDDRYFRFFGISEVSIDHWLSKLITNDNIKHIIQLVLDEDKVVAVADIAYRDVFSDVEIAISTASDYRKVLFPGSKFRLAVGLLNSVVDLVKTESFSEIVYSTLPENRPMLELGRKLGFNHKWVDGAVQGSMQI